MLRWGGGEHEQYNGAAPAHRNVLRLLQGDRMDGPGPAQTDVGHQKDIDQETQHCVADTLPAKGDEAETEDQGPELRLERPLRKVGMNRSDGGALSPNWMRPTQRSGLRPELNPLERSPKNSRPNIGMSWRISSLTMLRQLDKPTLSDAP